MQIPRVHRFLSILEIFWFKIGSMALSRSQIRTSFEISIKLMALISYTSSHYLTLACWVILNDFLSSADFIKKKIKIFFQKYDQIVVQFGSRSGPMYDGLDLGPGCFQRLSADNIRCMCGSRGVTRGMDPPPPLKNQKNIGFSSNTGLAPLKNHKATKPAFNVGPSSACQQNAI